MKKKVLAVTGIRSEYDILYPVIDTLRRNKNFEVKLVVCGVHLSDWHGFTAKKIIEDNFRIADRIDYLLMTDRRTQRAKGAGILTYALSQTVEREKPHFLLVVGDREESIAAAVVGNYMDVLVVHIGGGDSVYGNADDPVRFAVSKLAHVHLATTRRYAKNLEKIGEEGFRIFNTGNPGLDNIKNTPRLPVGRVKKFLNFDISGKNYVVLINHPLSSEKEIACDQMASALGALEVFCAEKNFKTVCIYPNTDPGAYDILKVMKRYEAKPFVRFYKTLPREIFVNVMRNARALVGNSSMGILEAPYYGLPVVNLGKRQGGRLNAGNVEFVSYDRKEIRKALEKACFDKGYRARVKKLKNPYGNGKAAHKIEAILSSIDADERKWHVKESLC